MIVYVAELRPALASTGAEQVLRYCSHPSASRTDSVDWKPTLTQPLRRTIQLFDGQFQGQPPDSGSLEFAISKGDPTAPLTDMVWDGRPVKVWKGTPGQTTAQMTVVFDGIAKEISGDRSRVIVGLRGNDWRLGVPLLSSTYAGTGLAEGPAELKGRLKPMLIGAALNLEPVYINRALGIFQYHGYSFGGAGSGAINAVYDSGSQLGASVGDFATYALLAAATIPAGQFATCNALGMGRHGGDITGVLTIDAEGACRFGATPGAILRYLIQTIGGLTTAQTKEDSFNWLDGQIAHALNIYITDQVTILEQAQSIMLTCGGYITYLDDGRVTCGLLRRGGASTINLNRLNIASLTARATSSPVWKRRLGYQRSWRVHSYSEVRTPKEINPRGNWSASPNPVYQYYDLVDHNNSSWLYIFATAGNGATPGTNGAAWQLFRANGVAVVESATTPASPVEGMLWRTPATGELKSYIGGQWVLVSTIGAKLGTNVTSSSGAAVDDSAALNSFVNISASGALAGGGGGQVTIGGLGFAGSLSATAGNNLIVNPSSEEISPLGLGAAGVSTGAAYAGTKSRFTAHAVSTTVAEFSAVAGDEIYFECYARVATIGRAIPYIEFLSGTGAILSQTGYYWGNAQSTGLPSQNDTTTFTRLGILSNPAPAGTATCRLLLLAQESSTGAYFDNLFAARASGWSSNLLTGRPTNLAALAGSEGINNALVSVSAGGALSGAGGGQVTALGIHDAGSAAGNSILNRSMVMNAGRLSTPGWGNIFNDILSNSYVQLFGTYLTNDGGATSVGTPIANSGISVAANGALSGAGGGQVTIAGLGYSGDLDGQRNNRITITAGKLTNSGTNLSNDFIGNAYIQLFGNFLTQDGGVTSTGTPIANSGISVAANGALSGAGGGQVTIGGLGFTGELDADLTSFMNPAARAVTKNYTHAGVAKDNEFPFDLGWKLMTSGNVDVTSTAVWTATLKSGNATFTIGSSNGILNVTACGSDAKIEVKATKGSRIYYGNADIVRLLDPPPASGGGGSGGSSANNSLSINAQTSSYGSAAGPILTAKSGSNGQVALSASADFFKATSGQVGAYGKWQWRAIGGSFADVAAETASQFDAVKINGTAQEPGEDNAGSLIVNLNKTGLSTSGTVDYEFQFLVRSAGANINVTGVESAQGS